MILQIGAPSRSADIPTAGRARRGRALLLDAVGKATANGRGRSLLRCCGYETKVPLLILCPRRTNTPDVKLDVILMRGATTSGRRASRGYEAGMT